ncbi:M20 metallopeptidase family protein [Kytococcus sp. Marseille-QA3725]
MTLLADAEALADDLTALRRSLHADPEVGLQTPRTQQQVLDALDGLPLEVTTGESLTSIVAVLRGEHPGPAVVLRADMDGLGMAEDTGLPFASTNGAMHACGHDLHTAALVGAARLLAERRDELHGSVILMFQPGEESVGGARHMVREGLLDAAGDEVTGAYALHVFPGERGTVQYRTGPAMAGNNQLHVTFHGRGGHSSEPSGAIDPVPALFDFGSQLQVAITRRISVFDPMVASITQVDVSGGAINVIPPEASLSGTVRTLSPEGLEAARELVRDLAEGIAAAHGCTVTAELREQYPATLNDPAQTLAAVERVRALLGADRVTERETPRMSSEDFSFVAQEVPGTFLYVAASPDGVDPATAAFNHSPQVLFDDAALPTMAAMLADLALGHLAAEPRTWGRAAPRVAVGGCCLPIPLGFFTLVAAGGLAAQHLLGGGTPS